MESDFDLNFWTSEALHVVMRLQGFCLQNKKSQDKDWQDDDPIGHWHFWLPCSVFAGCSVNVTKHQGTYPKTIQMFLVYGVARNFPIKDDMKARPKTMRDVGHNRMGMTLPQLLNI